MGKLKNESYILTQSWNMNWGSTTQSKKMNGLRKFFNERDVEKKIFFFFF